MTLQFYLCKWPKQVVTTEQSYYIHKTKLHLLVL